MNSGREIRDEQIDRRQAIQDRFISDALAGSDCQKAARLEAEAEVLAQNQRTFDAQVAAILDTASTETTDDN